MPRVLVRHAERLAAQEEADDMASLAIATRNMALLQFFMEWSEELTVSNIVRLPPRPPAPLGSPGRSWSCWATSGAVSTRGFGWTK